MKKTITFLCAGLLTLGLSAQNFGVGLDYMMLSGTMVKDTAGNAVSYVADGETESTDVSGSSAVLNLNYTYSINDDMSAVLSAGYGMGFGIVPLKAGISYGFSPSLSANVGMGLYMITDDSYVPNGSADGVLPDDYDANDPGASGSTNELGMNLGLKYHMNNIGIGLGYEMIKGGDHSSLNSFTIGLSYSFGGGSGDSAPADAAPAGK
jgi:hypothetical protein